MPICGKTGSDSSTKAGVGNVFFLGINYQVCESPVPESTDGVCMVLCNKPNVQSLDLYRPGVESDTKPAIIWNILCAALAME